MVSREEVYQTIVVLALASLILFVVSDKLALLYLAVGFLLLTLVSFKTATLITTYWLKFALALGKLNSTVLLFLVFYFILTPIAILFRLFNREKVAYFLKDSMHSYLVDVSCISFDFTKQW